MAMEKPLDPFDVPYNPKYVFDAEALYTCRPAGALRLLGIACAINMPPRWGFKTFGNPVCYKHVAPLGLKKLTQTFIMHIALLWSANNQRIATIDIPLLWSGALL